MGEFELIEKYFKVPHARKDVVMGPGDDCALLTLPPDAQLAVSTDTLVSGVHFFPDMDPVDLGYKALAVNLSDLAAMGAEPRWVSLALTLPAINERGSPVSPKGSSSSPSTTTWRWWGET